MATALLPSPQKIVIPQSLLDTLAAWAPPDHISMSEWAERYFVLSSEYSAKTGLIELEPGQKDIFDAVSDPSVEQVTLMGAVQMTKTLLMQVASAYFICENPGPMMFVSSKEDKAEEFSKDRFMPMCRDIDKLNARVTPGREGRRRETANTTWHKMFPGGRIDFKSANVKGNLVGKTLMMAMCDEIDLYPKSVEKSGSALDLIRSRLFRFGSRGKLIAACSPTIRNISAIEAEYLNSDQRKPYVACPNCQHYQVIRFATHVVFDKDLTTTHERAESARIKCESCEYLWTERERRRSIRTTLQWKAHAPFTGHAGFWISHLYGMLPAHSLYNLVKGFLECEKDNEKLQVFVNERLAELWDQDGERPAWQKVRDIAEDFPVGKTATVHRDCIALFAGVDQQASRLEMQVLGYGPDEKDRLHVWVVDYAVIEFFEADGTKKQTSSPEYWIELDRRLKTGYKHPAGVLLPIIAMSIDTSYNPDPVYAFAKRQARPMFGPGGIEILQPLTVLPIRGYDSEHYSAIARITERETARQRKDIGRDLQILTLGTGFLKTQLYSQLTSQEEPRRIHLPRSYNEDYWRGLVAEQRLISRRGEISFEKVFPRNEPLDTWVYAAGAFHAFKGDTFGPDEWDIVRRRFGLAQRGAGKQATPQRRVVESSYLKD